MLFSSMLFLCFFFPAVIAIHALLPARFRNAFLLAASLFFYAWGEIAYVPLIALSAAVNWALGLWMEGRRGAARRAALLAALALDIGMLGYYKYAGFVLRSVGLASLAPEVSLPLGISFYTFQTMAYVIDVYRGKVRAERSVVDYATFILLFPQLIAGPIVKYTDVSRALKERRVDAGGLEAGMTAFIAGLSAKVLLANQLGALFARAEANMAALSAPAAWLCLAAFGLQIYFDFAGYSLMAIGMGRMMGFTFPQNFNHPYAASSITDFWRRWHMTLSGWFRDYVYIPLGGNRRGLARGLANMLVVWLLTGLWHGASWNFVLWGLYYFVWLALERTALKGFVQRPGALRHVYALLVVLLGWALFAFEDLPACGAYAARLFSGGFSTDVLYYLRNDGVLLSLAALACVPALMRRAEACLARCAPARCAALLALLVLCVACLISDTYNPFLYFRF